MNIFSVLNMGKSSLRETSMSAMLAYLLDPHQDHGLGKHFLKNFLKLANVCSDFIDNDSLRFQVDLEVPYSHKNKRSDIDIQIKILDKEHNEIHRIIIENKIKRGAANRLQLNNYYEAVKSIENDDELPEGVNLSVIFLTPQINSNELNDEFKNLRIDQNDHKFWMYWNTKSDAECIVTLIQSILENEQKALISPINEYLKHTLKAFTCYIINTIETGDGRRNRIGEDIGELKQKSEISIGNELYTIILRDSGQIQLLDYNGDQVIARRHLLEFVKENKIDINSDNPNTRYLGMQIFKYLQQ